MIALCAESNAMLGRLVEAGDRGLPLDEIGAAFAITLALYGHAEITPASAGPQRALATSKGAAFAKRTAFA